MHKYRPENITDKRFTVCINLQTTKNVFPGLLKILKFTCVSDLDVMTWNILK